MKTPALLLAITGIAGLAATEALAQVGQGNAQAGANSSSRSSSRSQGGTAIIAIDNPASTTSTNSSRISGTQRIISAPPVSAPSLAAAGIETCLGSVSGGASFPGGGFSFGTTTKDNDCNRRLFGRQLYNMGYKRAAMVIHCFNEEVAAAMAIAGTPCPAADPQLAGTAYPVRAAAVPPADPLRGPVVVTDPTGSQYYGRRQRAAAPLPPVRSAEPAPAPGAPDAQRQLGRGPASAGGGQDPSGRGWANPGPPQPKRG